MTRFIWVTGLCVVALTGCGRTLVRETVVEKQPIVQRETVVERPAVTRETIVAGPASCTLGAAAYSDGTLSCQAGSEYRCMNGAWARVANSAC